MRLTNTLREAFVKAVMADVPDRSKKLREEAQKEFTRAELSHLPPEEAAVLMKYQKYFYAGTEYFGHIGLDKILAHYVPEDKDTRYAEVEKILARRNAANDTRDDLRAKLKAVAASCTTVKALHEALPEFAKYIADAPPPSKNLPALANVVADFVKAGWPAGAKNGNE